MNREQKLLQATQDILKHNLQYQGTEKTLLVYDTHSELSVLIADAYKKNLPNAEYIDFDTLTQDEIREQLVAMPIGSLVVLVQSGSFRLNEFRLRLELFNQGVAVIEHQHLGYFHDQEIDYYIDSLEYQGPFFHEISDALVNILAEAKEFSIYAKDGSVLTVTGGFEEGKKNIGDYTNNKNKGGAFPIGEVFTEAKDFSQVNGKLSIYRYVDFDHRVVDPETPFVLHVKNGRVTWDESIPDIFSATLEDVVASEGEVLLREFGFGFNPAYTRDRVVCFISAYERMTGLHISLGKKHNIYRHKLPKQEVQRYHIDIFPDVDKVLVDGKIIFEKENYTLINKK